MPSAGEFLRLRNFSLASPILRLFQGIPVQVIVKGY
jgi:hypothetical protein